MPLSAEEEGVFAVAALHGSPISPEDSRFSELTGFLRRASRALAEVAGRQHGQQAIDKAYPTWNRATASFDPGEVLTLTVEAAMTAVPAAEAGAIFLWDQKRQRLLVRAERNFPADVVELAQLARGQGYVGWVFEKRQAVLLADVSLDPRNVFVGTLKERSAMCVPLEASGQPIGALCLQNLKDYGAFQPRDLELLCFFAGQAALGLAAK